MMNKQAGLLVVLGALLTLLMPTSVLAKKNDTSPMAAPFKVAVVDTFAVMKELAPNVEAQLKKRFSARQKKLKALEARLRETDQQLRHDVAVLSKDERTRRERAFKAKARDFERMRAEYTEELNEKKNEALQKVSKNIQRAIKQLEKTQHYDLVLRKQSALWVRSNHDITADVLKRYHKIAKS